MPLRKDGLKKTVLTVTVAGTILALPLTSHAALGDRVLSQGIQHKDVSELQSNLKTLGYYTYKDITNYFGPITRDALLNFQRSNGLEVDGYFGPASYNKMMELLRNGASKPSEPKPSNPSNSGQVNSSRVLRLGLKGQDVKELQDALKALGYLKINNTTDYFGSMTRQALMDFQRAMGLEVDGYFGPASLKKINDSLAGGGNTKPENTKPSEDQSQESKPNDSNPSNPTNSNQVNTNRTLRLGLSGSDVKELQDALKSLGYLNIATTTDYFGTITRQALINFQASNGLEADGYFGPASLRKLNDILSGKTNNKPGQPNRGDEDRRALTIKLIATAKQYISVPYVFGGSTTAGFDCSGYTQFVYAKHNIRIPRTSATQANAGQKVSRENLEPGDLIIFSNTYQPGPSHTGIYLGNDSFIHSSSSGNIGVTISNLNEAYYKKHFSYGRRVY